MQETVKQKMNQMKLFGMQQAYHNLIENNQQQNLTNDDFINLLIHAEWEEKENRKITSYLKAAHLGYRASVEDIDSQANRNLDKTNVLRLTDCSFIKRK